MTNEYSIAVLLPTRGRTDALTSSVTSIVNLANNVSSIQLLFGFDDDDTVGLDHFKKVIQPFLDQHEVAYEAQVFNSMGYAGLNRYYNHLAKLTSADWLFVWNDDAVMETQGWDSVIEQYTGEFKLLKVHTHNDHPYSIFPVVPYNWFALFEHLSRHQMIDAELSQIAYMLNIVECIEVFVVHDRYDLTGNNHDETDKKRYRFEGDPSHPLDFHNPAITTQRINDTEKISLYMESINLDTTWWKNVKIHKQDPWEVLRKNDTYNQMHQYSVQKKL